MSRISANERPPAVLASARRRWSMSFALADPCLPTWSASCSRSRTWSGPKRRLKTSAALVAPTRLGRSALATVARSAGSRTIMRTSKLLCWDTKSARIRPFGVVINALRTFRAIRAPRSSDLVVISKSSVTEPPHSMFISFDTAPSQSVVRLNLEKTLRIRHATPVLSDELVPQKSPSTGTEFVCGATVGEQTSDPESP
jgi:hypothetical protein